ncbi:hypothetical protein QBC46DRAFT_405621 [Diplogelasinospora grovesii]|uniref:C2H2-type domain-containing protein n=1 Tax=Diplogelasinospora grovesii TaxID=303347 RepID=A0AAN6NC69_9PEZI|nr:hypothetical protein QBC46DRAFT_405621 [Diplogelasinospora grovesii]
MGMATVLSARPRSILVARSSGSSLSPGAIAGAVIGSLIGATLIFLCFLPFILRARRERKRNRSRCDGAGQAEMGQSAGGPIFSQRSPFDDSSRKLSEHHLSQPPGAPNGQYPMNGFGPPGMGSEHHDSYRGAATHDEKLHKPPAHLPPGVSIEQGLPSPISPPLSPTSGHDSLPRGPAQDGQAVSEHGPTLPKSRYESMGTIGTRDMSWTDSYGSPSRELTVFTSQGITEEPQALDYQSTHSNSHHQHHFVHLPDSIRNFVQRHSPHHRRDSRRSSRGGTGGARSPSITTTTGDVPTQSESAPAPLEVDTEARGEAWYYYNDPTLNSEIQEILGQSSPTTIPATVPPPFPTTLSTAAAAVLATATAHARLSVIPPTQASGSAPLSPVSPLGPAFPSEDASALPMPLRPLVEEPDALSPDSDKTVTPKDVIKQPFTRRQSSSLGRLLPGGPLQRTDSLPAPTIVSDIPSPPLQLSAGPSGNPMDLMKPTNDTEKDWMLKQEIFKFENSPPPTSDPAPTVPRTVNEASPSIKPDPSPEPDRQSPPEIELNGEDVFDYDMVDIADSIPDNNNNNYYYNYNDFNQLEVPRRTPAFDYDTANNLDISDYSTPPPSTGPSTENTPDTRLTDPSYTTSPSPRSDITDGGHVEQQPGKPLKQLHVCTWPGCTRSFDQPHKLNHHERYHKRPHPCTHPGCVMRFGTKTHLDRHINDKHNKTRKFYCTQADCPYSRQGGKSFPRKDNWRRHMQNKHHITPDPEPGIEFVDEVMQGT